MYYWGALTGIFLLFLLVNVVEVFVVILLVNSVNAAPLSLSLYFFYILTLNVPCFFFVSGLAACLGAVFSRVFGLFVSLVWFVFGVFWLPYILHGTFDYFSLNRRIRGIFQTVFPEARDTRPCPPPHPRPYNPPLRKG